MELDYIEGKDKELYDKFIEIYKTHTDVIKVLVENLPMDISAINRLSKDIEEAYNIYLETGSYEYYDPETEDLDDTPTPAPYEEINKFKEQWGEGSIVDNILIDNPDYYTNSTKTELKVTFNFPSTISGFDDSFGSKLTLLYDDLYNLENVTEFSNFGQCLTTLQDNHNLPPHMVNLGKFGASLTKFNKTLDIPLGVKYLGSFGQSVKVIRVSIIKPDHNFTDIGSFGASITSVTQSLYDAMVNSTKSLNKFGGKITKLDCYITLVQDNTNHGDFLKELDIPAYFELGGDFELIRYWSPIAKKWRCKEKVYIKDTDYINKQKIIKIDVISSIGDFNKYFGEGSIKDGVMYDNPKYYSNADKLYFVYNFSIPEGVTKLVGVGEQIKKENGASFQSDPYSNGTNRTRYIKFPKSLTDIGGFGKNLEDAMRNLVLLPNLIIGNRFDPGGDNKYTGLSTTFKLQQGVTYKLCQPATIYDRKGWVKGDIDENGEFYPILDTVEEGRVFYGRKGMPNETTVKWGHSQHYDGKSPKVIMPKGHTIPEGISIIEPGYQYIGFQPGFRFPKSLEDMGDSLKLITNIERGFTLVTKGDTLGENGLNLEHLTGGLIYPNGLTHMGDFGYNATTIDDDFVIPYGVTHLEHFGEHLTTLPKNFIIPDTVVDLGYFGYSLISLPKGFSIPDSVERLSYFGTTLRSVSKDFKISKNITTFEHFGVSFRDFNTLDLSKFTNITHMGYYGCAANMGKGEWVFPPNVTHLGYSGKNIKDISERFVLPNSITHMGEFGRRLLEWPTHFNLPENVEHLGHFGESFLEYNENHILPDSIINLGYYLDDLVKYPVDFIIPAGVEYPSNFRSVRSIPKSVLVPKTVKSIKDWCVGAGLIYIGTILHKGLTDEAVVGYYPDWYSSGMFNNMDYDMKLVKAYGGKYWIYGTYDWDTGKFEKNSDITPIKYII